MAERVQQGPANHLPVRADVVERGLCRLGCRCLLRSHRSERRTGDTSELVTGWLLRQQLLTLISFCIEYVKLTASHYQVQHQYSTFKQYFQQFIISPDPHARCKNRVNNSEPIAVGHAVRPGILTFDTKKIEESPASRHTCRFPHWSVKN